MLQLWDGFKCVLQEIVRKCEVLSLKYNAWSYQNRNTGLVWPCFRNQTTIICAVILPIKSPIQPFFFFLKLQGSEWHLTFDTTTLHLYVHQCKPTHTKWNCYGPARQSKMSLIQMSHHFQREHSWPTENPRWAHLHSRHPLRQRKSGEWTESALPRHTGTLGNGVTGSGVSAASMENWYCSSYFT